MHNAQICPNGCIISAADDLSDVADQSPRRRDQAGCRDGVGGHGLGFAKRFRVEHKRVCGRRVRSIQFPSRRSSTRPIQFTKMAGSGSPGAPRIRNLIDCNQIAACSGSRMIRSVSKTVSYVEEMSKKLPRPKLAGAGRFAIVYLTTRKLLVTEKTPATPLAWILAMLRAPVSSTTPSSVTLPFLTMIRMDGLAPSA